jgi:hypothetical protein
MAKYNFMLLQMHCKHFDRRQLVKMQSIICTFVSRQFVSLEKEYTYCHFSFHLFCFIGDS